MGGSFRILEISMNSLKANSSLLSFQAIQQRHPKMRICNSHHYEHVYPFWWCFLLSAYKRRGWEKQEEIRCKNLCCKGFCVTYNRYYLHSLTLFWHQSLGQLSSMFLIVTLHEAPTLTLTVWKIVWRNRGNAELSCLYFSTGTSKI